MRNRSLLHISKLEDFKQWVSGDYDICETKGDYEALRLKRKSNGKFVIGHKRDRADHVTIHGEGLFLIYEYLKDDK